MGIFDPQGLPSSPSSQQTTNQGLAPWAQPYVSNYLNQAQNLVSTQQTPELLNASYIDAKNLQLPGGFASGTRLAEAGGQGSLSTVPYAYQYGQQGAQYGAQGTKYGGVGAAMGDVAARAGDLYAQQATSPGAIQQYMSPYMDNVVDWQKQQAIRDYQIQAPQMAASAVGSGAFGGNRLTLQQAEANRGLQNRLAGIEATGQQSAFDKAQQAQQFGAQLGLQGQQIGMQGQQVGLQGLGTAMQGQQIGLQGVQGAQQGYAGATQAGGTLGNIASQEAQARLAALSLKNQFGLQQQQFPYQQQQFLRDQMSGLPVTQQNTQTTQAAPNNLSQILGLGGTLFSTYALGNMAKLWGPGSKAGGEVKRYAKGGSISAGMAGMGSDMGMAEYIRNHPEEAAAISAGMGSAFGDSDTPQNMGQMYQSGGMGAGISGLMPQQGGPISAGMGPGWNSDMPQQGGAIPMGQIPPQAASAMGAGMGVGMGPAFNGSNEDYVRSLYQNMLGREADQGGYQHNLDLLNAGKINQQDLAGAFRTSAEGQRMPSRNVLMGAASGYGYASGGIASINRDVINDPTDYSADTINNSKKNNVLGDISALLALNTIAKQKQNLQQQQAIEAGAQQPGSILSQLQAQVQPQMQQQMMPQQMAQVAPPQGIDVARSNLPQQFAGGGIIAFEQGGDVPRFYQGGAGRSAFREDLSRFGDYALPNIGIIKKLKELGSYFTTPRQAITDADAQPGGYYGGTPALQTAPVLPAGNIVIHPNAKPSAGAGPAAPAGPVGLNMPSLDYTLPATDTSVTDKALAESKRLIGGSGEDYEKAQKMAGITALMRASLALGGGASPYFMQNLNTAGQTGLSSYEQELQRIQGSKEKQAEKLAGIELRTPEMRRADRDLSLKEAKTQVEVPYYKSGTYENLAQGYRILNPIPKVTGTGSGGLGPINQNVLYKLEAARDEALLNPAANVGILKKLDAMNPDSKVKPSEFLLTSKTKTKSYQNAYKEYEKLVDMDYINKVNRFRTLSTKGSGLLSSED